MRRIALHDIGELKHKNRFFLNEVRIYYNKLQIASAELS
jgi:hypothetical protein